MRPLTCLALLFAGCAGTPGPSPSLGPWRLGVAQIRIEDRLSGNLAKILKFIPRAAEEGCRAVVFPEGALVGGAGEEPAEVDRAWATIREAASSAGIYVILGGKWHFRSGGRPRNWMAAADPAGREIFRYEKLYDRRDAPLPRTFQVGTTSAGAMICADRWLRGVEELPIMEGAGLSFELSNNYESEWVPALEWYWNVPRALRNGVYVVFANSAGPGKHGHSAVIAPDGSIVAAVGTEERLLTAPIDPDRATRAEALRRRQHAQVGRFWEAGLRLLSGGSEAAASAAPYVSPEIEVRLAAAQMACSGEVSENLETMAALIREAAAGGADVVAFPERAVTGGREESQESILARALDRLRACAREAKITTVFGTPWVEGGRRYNSAFALGPDGSVLTRYDQLVVDRPGPFAPGSAPRSMWFRVKGVPAVVTLGRDGLWSEIAELSSLAGAQLRLHLSYDSETGPRASLRRLQIGANLASFGTFTATVNAASPEGLSHPGAPADGGSALWEDLHARDEIKLALKGERRPGHEKMTIYSPFSANCLERAGSEPRILTSTQRVNGSNPHRSARFCPKMAPWYAAGARLFEAGSGF